MELWRLEGCKSVIEIKFEVWNLTTVTQLFVITLAILKKSLGFLYDVLA